MNRSVSQTLALIVGAFLSATLSAGAIAVSSPDIEVRTRVGADSVTVGERLRVVYEFSFPDTVSLVPPEGFGTGTCRVVSVAWKEEKAKGRATKTAQLEVMTMDLEKAWIPALTFLFTTPRGDTLSAVSDSVSVAVRHLTQADSKPKPLKPQWEAPRGYAFLVVIAAALALAAAAFWLIRRWRKREVVRAPEPELPADVVALQKLAEIERMGLLDAGEIKKYYTLVVDVLRGYLEKRYGFPAMDQTTDEILWGLRRLHVDAADIEPVLRDADLVKFAKHRPETAAAKGLIDAVRAIVARTAERPLLAAEAAETTKTAATA